MLVKSHPRKTATFSQLLAYLNQPASEMRGRAILHNLISPMDQPNTVLAEFLENWRLLKRRKNGNALYHEILSFSPRDRPHLTGEKLEHLTRRYIQLRCPDCLVYGKPHFDTDHPHVHLIISANSVGCRRPHRLSRDAFDRVKRQLEQHQLERYPELCHSIAQNRTKHPPERRVESELTRRLAAGGCSSRKQQIRQLVQQSLTTADSLGSLELDLGLRGLELYRHGSVVGVADRGGNRRYRLRTLGLLDRYEELVRRPDQIPEKTRRLADLKKAQSRNPDMQRSLFQDR